MPDTIGKMHGQADQILEDGSMVNLYQSILVPSGAFNFDLF